MRKICIVKDRKLVIALLVFIFWSVCFGYLEINVGKLAFPISLSLDTFVVGIFLFFVGCAKARKADNVKDWFCYFATLFNLPIFLGFVLTLYLGRPDWWAFVLGGSYVLGSVIVYCYK